MIYLTVEHYDDHDDHQIAVKGILHQKEIGDLFDDGTEMEEAICRSATLTSGTVMMIRMIAMMMLMAYMQKTCDVAEMAILAKKIGGKSA